jgi:hypothetical protein
MGKSLHKAFEMCNMQPSRVGCEAMDIEIAVSKLLKDSRHHYPYAEIVPKGDLSSISALGRMCFGQHSFTVNKFKSLLAVNPYILWRVKGHKNTFEGYLDILPVKTDFADALISGRKRESDLQPSDVIPENQIRDDQDGVIYIAGVVVSAALQKQVSQAEVERVSAKLAVAALDRIQHISTRSGGFSRVAIMPYQRGGEGRWSVIPHLEKLGFHRVGTSGEDCPVYQLDLHGRHELADIFVSIHRRRGAAQQRKAAKTKANDVLEFLRSTDELALKSKTIVGDYRRFDEQTINMLKDRVRDISSGLLTKTNSYENFLIWAAPGTGKTFLIEQIAKTLGPKIKFVKIDFAKDNKEEVVRKIGLVTRVRKPILVLYDEVDAKEEDQWPYDVSFRALDLNKDHPTRNAVFVLIGSKKSGLDQMIKGIGRRPKGNDLVDRVPEQNRFEIPQMTAGDRAIVMATQTFIAAESRRLTIKSVNKLAAYYVLIKNDRTPRQVTEMIKRAMQRLPKGETSLAYDYLFKPSEPRQYAFWTQHGDALHALQYTSLKLR